MREGGSSLLGSGGDLLLGNLLGWLLGSNLLGDLLDGLLHGLLDGLLWGSSLSGFGGYIKILLIKNSSCLKLI